MRGTVGILERAADEGLLSRGEASTRLKATDFWISEELFDERLRARELGDAGRSGSKTPP